MARTPKTREAKTGDIPKGYLRKRATGAEKVEYNVNKIATKVFAPPKPAKVTKSAKKTATKKKGKKVSATYLTLIKRALTKLVTKEKKNAGVSIPVILKYLYKNYPEKSDRKRVSIALAKGVANKSLVQIRRRFRLSAKELKKSSRKKTTKKSTGTKRKASTKDDTKKSGTKKAKTTKKTAAKKTTKKTASKKTATKKTATKKTATKKAATKKPATKRSATKKATTKKLTKKPKNAPQAVAVEESRGSIAEGAGVGKWQYYDNGWHDYYPEASQIVEGVYQEYKINTNLDVRAVKSGHFQYSIDFGNLQQRNIETGTVRNIKRVLA